MLVAARARERERITHPSISTIRVIWLNSLVPGNSGSPRNSSTQIQPRLHMSIMLEYGRDRMTSGER